MKQLVYLLLLMLLMMSCASQQKASITPPATAKVNETRNPRFLESISINPGKQNISSTEQEESERPIYIKPNDVISADILALESLNALQFKYAILLNLPIEEPLNFRLLEFIDEWYGTPYRYGGTTKKGIDCSAFVTCFMSSVYGLTVPRNSKDQFDTSKKIKKRQLEEGDLIFFNTRGGISHVGVYIGNNKFAHASTSSGVTISDLDNEYFSRRYVASGRIK